MERERERERDERRGEEKKVTQGPVSS